MPRGQLAAHLSVPVQRIYEAQARARRVGRLKPSERQFTRAAGMRSRPAAPVASDAASDGAQLDVTALLADIEQEKVLDTEQRRQVLSRLARRAPEPVRVSAVRALEELDRATGKQVGPPPPSSPEEAATRLATLLAAVGRQVGDAAVRMALEQWRREEAAPVVAVNAGVN